MHTSAVLSVRGLRRSFARVAVLRGVDLDVGNGEIVALLGPNGSGKTTTLKCIAGLLAADAGTIRVNGESDRISRENDVAYVPEIPVVYDDLSPREHLAFVAAGRRIAGAEQRIHDALHRTGLERDADRPAGTFSKGMRQRLCLAGAIVADARVLLLDEPTTGLDPAGQVALGEILRDLAAGGTAIVMSTHAIAIAFTTAARIAFLVDGVLRADKRIVAYADMDALRDDYLALTTA